MLPFNHIFIGIGNNGSLIVRNIKVSDARRIIVDTSDYLLDKRTFVESVAEFSKKIPENAIMWLIFENKPVNIEIARLMDFYAPRDVVRFAYVLSPYIELVTMKRPAWTKGFETVFYDSLWEVLKDYRDASIKDAFQHAGKRIGEMLSKLYHYLENDMLVNVDYADFFAMVKGGNVGIIRLLHEVDFGWHWGIWDRGLISIRAGKNVPLTHAHTVLHRFQDILKEKDVIWGVQIDENVSDDVEVLALLVKKW